MKSPRKDRVIAETLLSRPEIINAHVICIYVSLPTEVDTAGIIDQLLALRKIVVVPKVSQDTLLLYQIRSRTDLAPGPYGILEPFDSLHSIDKSSVDVFIVPGKSFDRLGNRKGKGKGYYDRLLRAVHVRKIGLAYQYQIVTRLPVHSYDIPMDVIITEKETITT